MNIILFTGCFLGFVSVSFGAYAEHGLQKKISSEVFRFVMTAVRYNQIYALLVVALGLCFYADLSAELLNRLIIVSSIFILGTILFSFSIYASAQFNISALTKMTPVGGITLMIGWLGLAWIALTASG